MIWNAKVYQHIPMSSVWSTSNAVGLNIGFQDIYNYYFVIVHYLK